jgi:hypothetical protein
MCIHRQLYIGLSFIILYTLLLESETEENMGHFAGPLACMGHSSHSFPMYRLDFLPHRVDAVWHGDSLNFINKSIKLARSSWRLDEC